METNTEPKQKYATYTYKRIDHFIDFLNRQQAKKPVYIPPEVLENILHELENRKIDKYDLDIFYLCRILKKLSYRKYYDQAPHILQIISGKEPLSFSDENQIRIIKMFERVQECFVICCPENRKNFLNYFYVLHKICELLGLNEALCYFPLLKNKIKLLQHDSIWKNICNHLGWIFHESLCEKIEDPQSKELIGLVEIIVDFLLINGPSKLSIISTHISSNTSVHPLWKRSKISFSDFIVKFPNIFALDQQTTIVSLLDDVIDSEYILESWKIIKTDMEILEQKLDKKLELFKLPSGLDFLVTSYDDQCNKWIDEHIYSANNNLIGFDTETTISWSSNTSKKYTSIAQLSTGQNNLIIQLSNMETMPKKLVDLLLDASKLKIGVAIAQDMHKIMQDFKDLCTVNGVVDLSVMVKNILGEKIPILSCGSDDKSYSLRDLAAIVLNMFIDNKGLSNVKKTDWDNLNLSQEQLEYAFIDSYLAIEICNKLSNENGLDFFNGIIQSVSTTVHTIVEIIPKKKVDKKEINKQDQTRKIADIERRIKKWLKDEESVELVFGPMNSFYRSHTHKFIKGIAQANSGIISESRGEEPSKYVALVKKIN